LRREHYPNKGFSSFDERLNQRFSIVREFHDICGVKGSAYYSKYIEVATDSELAKGIKNVFLKVAANIKATIAQW